MYIDIHSYLELANELIEEECIFGDSKEERDLLESIKNEIDEEKLKERLKKEGWLVVGGIAILLEK